MGCGYTRLVHILAADHIRFAFACNMCFAHTHLSWNLYSSKFSRAFHLNFQPLVKLFQQNALTARVSMDNIPGIRYWIRKQHSPKKYLLSGWHSIADSCEIEQTMMWQLVLDRNRLECHAYSTLRVQQICKIIPTKSSKTTIHEDLDS